MKRFTNSLLLVLCVGSLLSGCSNSNPSLANEEVAVVETATAVETAPKPEIIAPDTNVASGEKSSEEKQLKTSTPAPVVKSEQTKASVSTPAQKVETETAKDYPACLAEWDNRLQTLKTPFIQTSEYDGILISQSNGQIFYAKDGSKLRLDNLEEGVVTQTALTDRKKIYILDEKGKEISKVSWDEWLAGQPNQALFDFGQYAALLSKHTIAVQSKTKESVTLRLTPKSAAENYILYLVLNTQDCFPRKIVLEADLMKTTASLQQPALNAALNADVFKGLK